EVDVESGAVRVLRLVAVHESGRIINPLQAGSQVQGGVVQGLGYGLLERRWVDRGTGRVLNPNLEEYKLPTVLDVPPIEHRFVGQPDPVATSLGAKGIGEPPIIPTAPAIANAVAHALGRPVTRIPLTPDEVHCLLRGAS
ncbi:MAG: molybdopterin-dependent oxidoreductase, partial [Chloroflexi bacterium]|nr:molybdopterin-dependent oxidoreductase [Chloroflexota bacterium]